MGVLATYIQTDFPKHLFINIHQAVILQTVSCAHRHRLVRPITSGEKTLKVPRTLGFAQLHRPEHTSLGIQQVGCTHGPAKRTRALKSPLMERREDANHSSSSHN